MERSGVDLTCLSACPPHPCSDAGWDDGGNGGDGRVCVWCVRGGESCKEALKQLYLGC